ncbi:MAG: DMT family transporter [Desulfomonilia bacterium]|nr:DMT family transporter [Desulfomonilia bacterium]
MIIYLKLVMTAIFWGGTFVAGRAIAPVVGPFSGSFLRFFLASICLVILALNTPGGLPRAKKTQLLPLILLGLTGVFAYNVLFLAGLQTVTASRASIIIANNPVFLALFSAILFKEQLGGQKIFGILLCLTGAIIAITQGDVASILHGAVGLGELLIFGCVASWVAYSLVGKVVMLGMSPLIAIMYSSIFGGLFLLPPALAEGIVHQISSYPMMVWLGIFYLAFFGTTIGFTWYYQGIQAIGPARSGVFINLVPISAIALAALILGEKLNLSLLLGLILVTGGIFLTNSTAPWKDSVH